MSAQGRRHRTALCTCSVCLSKYPPRANRIRGGRHVNVSTRSRHLQLDRQRVLQIAVCAVLIARVAAQRDLMISSQTDQDHSTSSTEQSDGTAHIAAQLPVSDGEDSWNVNLLELKRVLIKACFHWQYGSTLPED